MSRHRTLRPTFPRRGAGRHRERPVVQRLSTAFLLTGRVGKRRVERITTALLLPDACPDCDPADIICGSCDKAWSV